VQSRTRIISAVRLAGLAAGGVAACAFIGCMLDRVGDGPALEPAEGGHGGTTETTGGFAGQDEGGGGGQGGTPAGMGGMPNTCGDHVLDAGEACDDGNATSNDGCSACAIDAGFTCGDDPNTCVRIEQALLAGPGLALMIVDEVGHYTGNLASMDCATLTHAGLDASQIESVRVRIAMSHTWVGDLVLKLVSPEGTTLTLLSRPGAAETVDSYAEDPTGDNADIVATTPIEFYDGAPNDAEAMGTTLPNGNQIVCVDDALCAYFPNPGVGPGTSFADFTGESPVGDWRLCAADGDNNDNGSIDTITLTVRAAVPPR
jgi:cysteine-rich repeat protein